MKKLPAREIEAFCTRHAWGARGRMDSLTKAYKTKTFLEGLAFITQIAVLAEAADHHPDITLTYGAVQVTLSTHDAGGITKLDTALAKKIDSCASKLVH